MVSVEKTDKSSGGMWRWFAQALTQQDSFAGYFQPFIELVLPKWHTDSVRAKVIEVKEELSDMFTLVLQPSPTTFDYKWQRFEAGQYVELIVEQEGARLMRCFSISSSPDYFQRTGLIELSIRVQPKGRITPWLPKNLKKGNMVNISTAKGDFVLPDTKQPLLLIAGGSGVTPFRSMLQQLYRTKAQNLDIKVLYYSRSADHVAFEKEFLEIDKSLTGVDIHFIDSEQDGFISTDHIQKCCPDFAERHSMICGPVPMIQAAKACLDELAVPADQIEFEYFGAAPVDMPEGASGVVSFAKSGLKHVDENGNQSILDGARAAGLDPLVGCGIGVCHQCICKKKSGVVYNTRTGEYSDSGLGEVQICVSVAQGDVVLDI